MRVGRAQGRGPLAGRKAAAPWPHCVCDHSSFAPYVQKPSQSYIPPHPPHHFFWGTHKHSTYLLSLFLPTTYFLIDLRCHSLMVLHYKRTARGKEDLSQATNTPPTRRASAREKERGRKKEGRGR